MPEWRMCVSSYTYGKGRVEILVPTEHERLRVLRLSILFLRIVLYDLSVEDAKLRSRISLAQALQHAPLPRFVPHGFRIIDRVCCIASDKYLS